MSVDRLIGTIFLLFLAFFWGLGFVFQRLGMDHVGPFTFNAARFVIGAMSLLPVLAIFARSTAPQARPTLFWASLAGGFFFFIGITLQQIGIIYTTAGKAAFITGLYIVLVPIFSIVLGQIARWNVWLACLLAIAGLYFMAETGSLRLEYGDALILACSAFWAIQIIIVGLVASKLDPVTFAFGQILVVAAIAVPLALLLEDNTWADIWAARWAILFVGVIDTGLTMVLQILGQRRVPATPAGIIMSLEAVFGALCGYLFLAEVITQSMFYGMLLMLAGMVLAQLTLPPLWRHARPKGSL